MSQSLTFIDTKLSDYQSIIDSLSSTDTYYLIHSDGDGLTQVAAILSGYSNLDALHVFSHGSIGSLNLGSTIVNQTNIASYEFLLQQIGSSLTTNGDILLYGCNVAQGDIGQAFINTITSYTGADVAASTDITGSSALGGDWELEVNSRSIETQTLVASYASTMGTTMVKLEAIWNATGNDVAPQITAVGTAGEYIVTFHGVDSAGDYSIFVQKFNANGTVQGSMVKLEAIGNTAGADNFPQITAVGTTGEYVVTFMGTVSAGDYSIFVQKFNANGTVQGSIVQLEAIGNTTGTDHFPQITAVGATGEYVVTFMGTDSAGDDSIFVQKFNANGTMQGSMVQLEAIGNTTGYDHFPQITAVGTTGEYVVTFHGVDSVGDYSIFVQKFNADGTVQGSIVQLEAIGNTTSTDHFPQITAVGTAGEYVVTFHGIDSAGDFSIFVQKFNANGTMQGSIVQLEAIGKTTGADNFPQITAVGTTGEYVVTFMGTDSASDASIFVQKFNANGTMQGSMVQLEAIRNTAGYDYYPQITAVGTAGEYVVTFMGTDSASDASIFVQKFNANGTMQGSMVQLEAIWNTTGNDVAPQITAVGTTGEYVVTFHGIDSAGDYSIFVQKFNADGTIAGGTVANSTPTSANITLTTNEATAKTLLLGDFAFNDVDVGDTLFKVMITTLPSVGTLKLNVTEVILNQEILAADITAGKLIYTPAANAFGAAYANFGFKVSDGAVYSASANTVTMNVTQVIDPLTTMVKLEAIGNTAGNDVDSQITAVGTVGEYVVTFQGIESAGDQSIFVQKFNADGTVQGSMVQLEAIWNTTGNDVAPQITAVGTAGEYVVTFHGVDSAGDSSIFVQKFNANGTVQDSMVQLEAIGKIDGYDSAPQITAVGTAGEYVVTFQGIDSTGDRSIFIQKFNANGTIQGSMVQLEAIGNTTGYNYYPQITTVGTAGEYVVTFYGVDSTGDYSIFVQKFNANGTTQGSMVQLEVLGVSNESDYDSQITAVGTAGEYVVTFDGTDSTGDGSIFVQKFNANGTTQGSMVQLEALGVSNGGDYDSQITAVGTAGEYVVTFQGDDSTGDYSIFVQKFNANGTIQGSMVQLEAIGKTTGADNFPQITAVGTTGEYVVTFRGIDSAGDASIFVQKFNANGTVQGFMVQLEAIGKTTGWDWTPQITAVGTAGEYVVTFMGTDSAGDDSIFVQKFNADGTIAGTTSAPLAFVTSTNDTLVGSSSNNYTLSCETATKAIKINLSLTTPQKTGGSGTDTISGFENLTGSSFNDTLTGDANDNILSGLAGNDALIGGAGNDTLDGGTGADKMTGGLGNDVYFMDNTGDKVTEATGSDNDTVYTTVTISKAINNVENFIAAGIGAINILGNTLHNTLIGNDGINVLDGGLGNDTLTGGNGNDTFKFSTKLNTITNIDTITDFNSTDDTIQLSKSIFKSLAKTFTADMFKLGTQAADANNYLIYDQSTGKLYYDADGSNAKIQAIQIALIGTTDHPALTFGDFEVA